MSDFLIQVDPESAQRNTIPLMQIPYRHRRPEGESFTFPWGSVTVLQERFGKNIYQRNGTLLAWVGDLVTRINEPFLASLAAFVDADSNGASKTGAHPPAGSPLDQLNGSFAFVIANATGFSVITDPMNYVQVYMATDDRGRITAVGTHPDIVAHSGGQASALDLTSIGEFLNAGTPLFPNTAYRNVKELHPGSVYRVSISNDSQRSQRDSYWSPPSEVRNGCSEASLADELREILLAIVRSRCEVGRVGVFLSGGLDSRLIMAAVPRSVECVGLTFSNHANRETRTAQRVAACYDRDWVLLVRDPEYLANCLIDAVKLTGCEYEWTCGQVIGVAPDLKKLNLDVVLEGTLFNDYFTAFCAREWQPEKRLGGLLPSRYQKTNWDYLDQISPFWRKNLSGNLVTVMRDRRRQTYDSMADPKRGSIAEWLEIYPFTQDPTVGYWPAERRTLPVRLVAMDRRALDFSFRCPIELKLGGKLYRKAAHSIFGKGNRIPNANDGVRPGSGHWSRLAQRARHEVARRGTRWLGQLRGGNSVPHSWHDYPRYWRESAALQQLRGQYGSALDEFDGTLIAGRGRDLLNQTDLPWDFGFRLLQLAVWRELSRTYKISRDTV